MNRFVKGIILLSIAAFFAECLEFVVNMILARELGEHGMGLYMSILQNAHVKPHPMLAKLPRQYHIHDKFQTFREKGGDG